MVSTDIWDDHRSFHGPNRVACSPVTMSDSDSEEEEAEAAEEDPAKPTRPSSSLGSARLVKRKVQRSSSIVSIGQGKPVGGRCVAE